MLQKQQYTSSVPEKAETPYYVFDVNLLRKNFSHFKEVFPNFTYYYSVKTNPLERFLVEIGKLGSNFDAATIGEIELLLKNNIEAAKILFTHPIKSINSIQKAFNYGVNKYAFDSVHELKQLAKFAPNAKYYLRVRPPVEGSFYEYSDKFGASIQEIEEIFDYAIKYSLKICGLSFHVGSQNMSLDPWTAVLRLCEAILDKYYKQMPCLRVINIGSGFPYKYLFKECVSLEEIAATVKESTKNFPKDIEFWAEPGRILVADTGMLVCTIQRKMQRVLNNWLFVDMGIYHGLIEILESRGKLTYPIEYLKKGKLIKYNISGNTLDPDDTFALDVFLPENLTEGDKIIFHDVGAYTASFFTEYHAMPRPNIYFIDEK